MSMPWTSAPTAVFPILPQGNREPIGDATALIVGKKQRGRTHPEIIGIVKSGFGEPYRLSEAKPYQVPADNRQLSVPIAWTGAESPFLHQF
jgi:hypothetical protein